MRHTRLALIPVLVALLLGATGCGGSSSTHTVTVFAASSLQQPFTVLGQQFEKDHPGTKVRFSFGASSDLATQVQQGAPADVLATASTTTMDQVDQVEDVKDFARNTMEIAVPAKNPAHITSLRDLARPGVKVAVCQAQVPCGVVAATVLKNAGLHVEPVTEEADVKSVLTKVELDEVDAGIVYVSDVHTAPSTVRGVPIPAKVNAVTTYPISVLATTKSQSLAEDFVSLVLSRAGRKAMADAGFAGP
jgi:molybdate transport system substrate-binding protein